MAVTGFTAQGTEIKRLDKRSISRNVKEPINQEQKRLPPAIP